MKKKRKKDTDLLASIRKKPCLACGKNCPSDPHHLKTVGSGGGDDATNVIPLCREHHQLVHKIGLVAFAQKYPSVRNHLLLHGWYYNETLDKWLRPLC